MHLVGMIPVRNEDWIIGLSLRAQLLWMDEVVVWAHRCEDRTLEIIAEIQKESPGRVHVVECDDVIWHEQPHRQMLLESARVYNPTHIAFIDADEILTGNLVGSVRDLIESIPSGGVIQAAWHCMWRSPFVYCAGNSHWATQWASFACENQPHFRWGAYGDYDMHRRHPMGTTDGTYRPVLRELGGLMHLQFVVKARLLAKQARYKMIEASRWPGRETPAQLNAKMDRAVIETGVVTSPAPEEWWDAYRHWLPYLDLSLSIPWQALECQQMMKEFGPEKFRGLDLYGVC